MFTHYRTQKVENLWVHLSTLMPGAKHTVMFVLIIGLKVIEIESYK